MKKNQIILLTIFLLITIPQTVGATNQKQIPINEVEELIDTKLSENRPLTYEELNKAVIELKDEKIKNLEGNLSTLITYSALLIGLVTLFLAVVGGIIGWLIRRGLDDKLTEIKAKETSINEIKTELERKLNNFEENFREIKSFMGDFQRTNIKLEQTSLQLDKNNEQVKLFRSYLQTVEDVVNSSLLAHRFYEYRSTAFALVEKTGKLLQARQKSENFVVNKIAEELNAKNDFSDYQSLLVYYQNYLVKNLLEEEKNFISKLSRIKKVNDEYFFNIDEEDSSSSTYEELYSTYKDWKGYYDDIHRIEEIWGAFLAMNAPTSPEI